MLSTQQPWVQILLPQSKVCQGQQSLEGKRRVVFLPQAARLPDGDGENDEADDDDDGRRNDGQDGHRVDQDRLPGAEGDRQDVGARQVELADVGAQGSGDALQLREVGHRVWSGLGHGVLQVQMSGRM